MLFFDGDSTYATHAANRAPESGKTVGWVSLIDWAQMFISSASILPWIGLLGLKCSSTSKWPMLIFHALLRIQGRSVMSLAMMTFCHAAEM